MRRWERPAAGPTRVITDLGVYGFDEATREMTLESVHPGVTLAQVREATGWDLKVAAPPRPPRRRPTRRCSACSGKELDPERIYLKG